MLWIIECENCQTRKEVIQKSEPVLCPVCLSNEIETEPTERKEEN